MEGLEGEEESGRTSSGELKKSRVRVYLGDMSHYGNIRTHSMTLLRLNYRRAEIRKT
jgi:hypothetical protein